MRNFSDRKNDLPVYTVVIETPPPPRPPKPPKEFFPVSVEKEDDDPVIVDEVAKSAMRLEHARKISLVGDVIGAALFDGSDDISLKTTVKISDRAVKDAKGNEISKTYARKSDLELYASKSDVGKKINYLETVLHATKEAVNKSLRQEDLIFAEPADIADLFGE